MGLILYWRKNDSKNCTREDRAKTKQMNAAAKELHGIQNIPELQELRHRLGLSRSQADYQDLLDLVQAQPLNAAQMIIPRKDGTVQIGSFPRPIW